MFLMIVQLHMEVEILLLSTINFITSNVTQIYLGFLFNIYTKLKYEDEK